MRLKIRIFTGVLVLAITLLTAFSAYAGTYWAVTASASKLYLLSSNGFSTSVKTLGDISSSNSTLPGIAVHENMVFVTDPSANTLRIGQLSNVISGSTGFQWINTVKLKTNSGLYVNKPKTIVASSSGIYVLGSQYSDDSSNLHSCYAYLDYSTNWSSPSISIADLSNTIQADAAASDSGVILANRNYNTSSADETCVTRLYEGSGSSYVALGDGGYFPRAIASGTNGFSYIVNQVVDGSNGGSISTFGTNNLTKADSVLTLPNDFVPQDVAFFTVDNANYLGIVGVSGTSHQALRILINNMGIPDLNNIMTATLNSSVNHFCTVSDDNSYFWVTDTNSKMVDVINTSTWAMMPGTSVYDSVGAIATYVPEPSSLLILVSMGAGLVALRRRTKS